MCVTSGIHAVLGVNCFSAATTRIFPISTWSITGTRLACVFSLQISATVDGRMGNELRVLLVYVFVHCSDTPIRQVLQTQSSLYCVQLSIFLTRGHGLPLFPREIGTDKVKGDSCLASDSTVWLILFRNTERWAKKVTCAFLAQKCNLYSLFSKVGDLIVYYF